MSIEVGVILEGKVTGISNFGAFIALPDGKSGMVHISEISSNYVKEIRDYIKEGDQVKVKVISVDERGKIGLSIKKAQEESAPPEVKKSIDAPVEYINPNSKKRSATSTGDAFEDMLNKFKADSDEKISDLKKVTDSKRSSAGFQRKNTNKY
ncbi:MAG: S1 RNA-binding domain-containing protein [Oscillospiraceae bacterium]|nr:S1 RNA-binding domain-containing protein [Oscillospiraceae bacterium]